MDELPNIALTAGDPAGIGPEVVGAAFRDERVRARMRLVGIGPGAVRPVDGLGAGQHSWVDCEAPGSWEMGKVQASCGAAALDALRIGHGLASRGEVAALVTAPVNKEALHAAGERVEGQTELLSRWAGVERTGMLAVVGNLRVMLLTRHMPLVQAIASIEPDRVVDHLALLAESLDGLGIRNPRLALAGLNPHAGEHGLLGCEEGDLLVPAVERAREDGLDVTGPVSPDAVFVQARDGLYDGVLALYHDQAFIALKLIGQERGLTVLAGLPYLRVSPVHGTAFDIAGQGRASSENLIHALIQAADWCRPRPA
ncbi:MAG: 4-hydroxythreonine-4-phosphate dehydrogenase [Chlamydiales bacterium]|jgi:4-hydroxythreonine-4-phosphate dehydrogenase